MKRIIVWVLYAALSAFIFSKHISCASPSAKNDTTTTPKDSILIDLSGYDRYYNDIARCFAGMDQETGSKIKGLDTNEVYQQHKKNFTAFFDSAYQLRMPSMKAFRDKHLQEMNDSVEHLFYPFSGPDFVHADVFFPNMKNIYMIGLERTGEVPKVEDLSDQRLETFFKAIRISLDSIFTWGYFMTNDMNKDFARSLELKGLTPVFMLFMAKSGFRVLDVEDVTINKQGRLVNSLPGRRRTSSPWDTYISGVHITYYKPGDDFKRNLYYFSHNVSDKNLKVTPELLKFFKSRPINGTFMKAASYLCWYFKEIRKFAVSTSDYIFQTDSGIPILYLPEEEWKAQYFGFYKRPIGVFKWAMQKELKAIYQTDTTVIPIDFGIGYGFRYDESNLMYFKRKK